MAKNRQTRSDCTVGRFEKKHGLPAGTIRNKNGRDTRTIKKLEPSDEVIEIRRTLDHYVSLVKMSCLMLFLLAKLSERRQS